MEKVIVTGATGFIGKSVVKEFTKSGYEVIAITRKISSFFSEIDSVHNINCDMEQIEELPKILSELGYHDIKYFIHLAWEGTSGLDRECYNLQLKNVKYTCSAVEVAKELGCQKFIYAGSIMEYEAMKYIPNSASEPAGNYIYRTAKMTAHFMGKSLAKKIGIDFTIATISNAYGQGEVSERLINSTIRKLLKGEETSFTSGEQLYDFIYITDVARAFRYIVEQGKSYGNYYIGNKHPRKLKEFLIDLKDCIDKSIVLGFGKIEFNGICLDYTEFNTEGLYEDTDFYCKVDFKEGIKKTIRWIEEKSMSLGGVKNEP